VTGPSGTGQHAAQGAGRRLAWLWVPVVLLVGLVAGGVVVAAFGKGTTVRPPGPTTTVTASPSSAGGGDVSLDAGCLRAVHDAQSAYSLLGRVADAVRSFDASRLDEIVLQLGQLRHDLQNDLSGCHAVAHFPAGPTPSK
jgi:hypothetical protein